MGGNIFVDSVRIPTNTFKTCSEQIIHMLSTQCPTHIRRPMRPGELHVLRYYTEKPDHGDMDILVPKGFLNDFENFLHDRYKTSRNGDQLSFLFNDLHIMGKRIPVQVDLIGIDPDRFESAKLYFDYNDLGGMMGVIANNLGLKLAPEGLFYKVQVRQDHADILVTADPGDILDLLGYSSLNYIPFQNMQEIYNFVSGSIFFDARWYSFESMDHKNRIRNRKRKSFQGFLEYIQANPGKCKNEVTPELVQRYNEKIRDLLQGAAEAKEKDFEDQYQYRLMMKEKFNGHLISEWTGLAHGPVMGSFKAYFLKYADNQKILETGSVHDVEKAVKEAYKQYLDAFQLKV